LAARFRPAGDSYCFAFERRPQEPKTPVQPGPPARRAPAHTKGRAVPARHSPPPPAASTRAAKDAAPATPPEPEPAREPALDTAARLADQGRHGEAADLCESEIRASGPSAPALFLLGVVRQALGERAQAERCFEKAVYLDPGHEEALLALSAAARRRGDLEA